MTPAEGHVEIIPTPFFSDPWRRVVVLSGASPAEQRRVSMLCRKQGAAFYTVETFGYDG